MANHAWAFVFIYSRSRIFAVGPEYHDRSLWARHAAEFLRFLYILAHLRTKRWFERLGYEPSDEAFKFRRGQYFWHTRAAIGHATALAVARRARVAEHTLRRNRAGLHPQDDLLHPYTAPVAI